MMITAVLFAAAAAAAQAPAPADKTEIQMDMPWRAEPNRPYQLHLTYHIAANEQDPLRKKSCISVYTDDNGEVDYAKRQLDLEPEKQTDLPITQMHETPSGLTWVCVNTNALPPPNSAALSIDLGFRGRVSWQDKAPLESWRATPVPLQFVDAAGKPLPLNAPIIVDVTASNAQIRFHEQSGGRQWSEYATTGVTIGQSDIGTFEIEPQLFGSGRGVLRVRGYINDRTQLVFDALEPFEIMAPWWIRLGVAILGALTSALYQAGRTATPERRPLRLLGSAIPAAALAGLLAWALSDLNLLGIRADTTRLTGYFVLGLLVAYSGVDALLRRLAKPQEPERREEHAAAPEPTTAQ